MANCPICSIALAVKRQREGVYYPCESCNGRALTIPQTRRLFGDAIATKLLRLMKLTTTPGRCLCPFCSNAMILVALHDPALQLEACNSCSVVWFDAPSFELLPQIGFESTNALSMQSTDVLAAMRLKDFNAKQQAEDQAERKKKRLGRFFGGKRKSDEPPQS